MENFEAGVVCCWSGHKFVAGERGMKCLTCGRVMTNEAWEEKGKCFGNHTNSNLAIATNTNISHRARPTRLEFQDLPLVQTRRQLEWRDPPPVRHRRQLKWRDPRTTKWKIITISTIVLLVLFLIVFLLKK